MSPRYGSLSTLCSPPGTPKDSRKNIKRPHRNHYPISRLSPSRKREVELWRRDQKAAARDVSYTYSNINLPVMMESTASTITHTKSRFSAPTLTLPSTSDAFNLFPRYKRRRRSSPRPHPRYDRAHISPYDQINSIHPPANLNQLRSHAFWELQNSVAETGEGFVRKMRDWEDVQELQGRKRQRLMTSRRKSNTMNPDDDDVMIYSGESPRAVDAQNRAFSVEGVESEASSAGVEGSEICSLPVEQWGFVLSPLGSDDDDDSLNPGSDNPGSTTSIATNLSSSPMSWSCSSESPMSPLFQPQVATSPFNVPQSPGDLSLPSSASHSDKALAALTLALANGAGGLNDYDALLNSSDYHLPTGDYQVGELWD